MEEIDVDIADEIDDEEDDFLESAQDIKTKVHGQSGFSCLTDTKSARYKYALLGMVNLTSIYILNCHLTEQIQFCVGYCCLSKSSCSGSQSTRNSLRNSVPAG